MSSDDHTEMKSEDEIKKGILKTLSEFEEAASMFANVSIKNDKLKKRYTELIEKAKQEVLDKVVQDKVSPKNAKFRYENAIHILTEAVESANSLRNAYIENVNKKVSQTATKKLKEKGLGFDKWLEKYTPTRTGTTSHSSVELELTELTEQNEVMETVIIKASGKTNLCKLSKGLGKFGYACILFTIAHSIYTICEADNPIKETVGTAVSLGSGIVGVNVTALLGAKIGAFGGPIGVGFGAITGGIAGGFIAAYKGEEFVNKLYTDFFPSSHTGTGPPAFDVIPVLYGQPSLDCIPVIGSPNVGHGISRRDKPHLREQPVVGLPKLWPN